MYKKNVCLNHCAEISYSTNTMKKVNVSQKAIPGSLMEAKKCNQIGAG
jgi:hypothetical protein